MKIVLCNGDSSGMPREDVSFQSCWYFKLANDDNFNKDYLFVHNFRRAFNTSELSSKDFLENYQPNIVVVQVGIVDCAPRLYKTDSLLIKIINRIPFVSRAFWKIGKRFKKRKLANAHTPLELFRNNIFDYLSRCKENKIECCILIQIQTPAAALLKKNPQIIEAVQMYNKVYAEVASKFNFVKVINPLGFGNNLDFVEDGYHPNEHGFQKVFTELKNILDGD